MAENGNGNGKKRVEFIYTVLGVVLLSGAVIGSFWTVYARPKVCEQSRIEITNWWGETGALKVEKMAIDICERKVAKIEDQIDKIYRMNLRRLNRNERAEFELSEDTINH